MLDIEFTGRFRKDFKKAIKCGYDERALATVVGLIQAGETRTLMDNYKDHPLTDSKLFKGCRECHIEPDWILVYEIISERLVLRLLRTGTHSDIFKK